MPSASTRSCDDVDVNRFRRRARARANALVTLALSFVVKASFVAVFARGFLLARAPSARRATCDGRSECQPARVGKIVIVIIDGARYDWVKATKDGKEAALGEARALTMSGTSGARGEMFKFIADPPTTTEQRLRGILCGSLPTFVDIGSSFGGGKVLAEDDVVGRLRASGKRLAFVGDDVWERLFDLRDTFQASARAIASFDVKDVVSVDRGVREAFEELLAKPSEWDALVGHMLGADHVGHTFGAKTSEMRDKLIENNEDIRRVAAAMRADEAYKGAMLFVFGDHGMTDRGDHGGGTAEEVESFLLAYSPWGMSESAREQNEENEKDEEDEELMQIDFAATLATLAGVPIPHGNLGAVNEKIFNLAYGAKEGGKRGKNFYSERFVAYSNAVFANAEQIWTYINSYGDVEHSSPFRADDEARLRELMLGMRRESDAHVKVERAREFMKATAEVARSQWARFGAWRMTIGLCGVVLVVGAMAFAAYGTKNDEDCVSPRHSRRRSSDIIVDDYSAVATIGVVLVIVASLGRFSDNYIVKERGVSRFLFATYAVALGARATTLTNANVKHASIATALALFANSAMYELGSNWMKSDASAPSRTVGIAFAIVAVVGSAGFASAANHFVARRFQGTEFGVYLTIFAWFANAARSVEVLAFDGDGYATARVVYACSAASATALAIAALSKASDVDLIERRCASIVVVVTPLVAMLAGPAMGVIYLGLTSVILASTAFLILGTASKTHVNHRGKETTLATGATLASSVLFCGGGHLCSFDGLHFAAAFTGFKTFNFYGMGLLLAFETWSGDILLTACAPIIAARLGNGRRAQSSDLSAPVARIAQKMTLFRSIPAACAVGCAALHRRHLMVWAIFAPKFVYDAIGSTVGDFCTLAFVYFASRARARALVREKSH